MTANLRGVAVTLGTIALFFGGGCPTLSVVSAAEGGCANEARRAEQSSTYLPNCRGYEQVTPAAKDSAEPQPGIFRASPENEMFTPTTGAFPALDGNRMAWTTEYPGLAAQVSTGLEYLSSRSAEGWSTEAVVPPQSPVTGLACAELPSIVGWARNLTRGVLADDGHQEYGKIGRSSSEEAFAHENTGCVHAEPALMEANGAEIKEPAGFQNLFLRDNESGFYQLVNVTPATAPDPRPREGSKGEQPYFPPNFVAGSADLERVAFEDELPLTEEAEMLSPEVEVACKEVPKGRACWEGHDDLYVWSEGQQPAVRLVSILPDGQPAEGMLAGSTRNGVEPEQPGILSNPINIADYRHAVSADGSRIFFEAQGSLYARENGGAPQTALGGKDECIEPAKACTIQLDLPQGGTGAGGGGKWLGANAEGTKVFFTDQASAGLTSTTVKGSGANLYEYELPSVDSMPGTLIDLTPDTKAEVVGMSGVNEDGSYVYFVAGGQLVAGEGTSAEPNLYLSHEGTITFVATLSKEDLCDWTANTGCGTEPNNPRTTGLTARVSGNGLYLAFDSVNQLTAYVNADPTTSEAAEEVYLYEAEGHRLACASCNPNPNVAPSAGGAAIDWPTPVNRNVGFVQNAYPQRNVSEAGQVFFETSEELLPDQDTSGVRNVYEYEDGALHLISSGVSTAPSYFLGASASGSDVFFATAQKLLPRDTDTAYDIYDARTEGGFPEPSPSREPCESEGCSAGAAAPAVLSVPSSATFAGTGNIVQPKTPSKPKAKKKKKLKAKKTKQRRNAKHRRALRNGRRHGHRQTRRDHRGGRR